MTPPADLAYRCFQSALLRGASLIVPAKQRTEWRQEWHAELWHVRRECAATETFSWQAQCEVIWFCLGAFRDAVCLRRHSWRRSPFLWLRGSAQLCLIWLATVLAVSCALAHLLPGVRAERDTSRYQVNPGVVLIQDSFYYNDSLATIRLEQFRTWKERAQRYFDDLAFYRITRETISAEGHDKSGWEVAHASSNLFKLLGLPIQFVRPAGEADSKLPKVILSERAWKEEFGGNPHIAGNMLRIGRLQAVVIGVIPDGEWRLPGKADLWLLGQDSEIASDNDVGNVVAHLNRLGLSKMSASRMSAPRVLIDAYSSDDYVEDLWGVSFKERLQGPWGFYEFTILLAFLALPAVTSVSLGEYNIASHKPSWSRRLYRWGFLIAKTLFVLTIAYYVSLDVAYWHTARYSPASEYAQLVTSFSISLLGMRWVLLDQRQRCPVCLRCVTSPAQVGVLSRTFLGWNGTELMCAGGHTLLHVPGLPTSWFGTQRWVYLDASWAFLFAGSGAG